MLGARSVAPRRVAEGVVRSGFAHAAAARSVASLASRWERRQTRPVGPLSCRILAGPQAVAAPRWWQAAVPLAHRRCSSAASSSGGAGDEAATAADDPESLARYAEELRARAAEGNLPGTGAEEAYALAFTCGVCNTRSAKKISKRAYHHGVVIVTCFSCNNRHLIADRLKWFGEEDVDIETMMREKGEEVVKLNKFRLQEEPDGPMGPLVEVEGVDFSTCETTGAIPAPVVVPELSDEATIAAAGEAAAAEVLAARQGHGTRS